MKLGIISSHRTEISTIMRDKILDKYCNIENIDSLENIYNTDSEILIALGGDGFILRVLHKIINYNKNIKLYGINCGNVGFLLNSFDIEYDDLLSKIKNSVQITLFPLSVEMEDKSGLIQKTYAINETSLIRQTYQAVNIKIIVNGDTKIESLIGDGVLLSTTTGSAAYNVSVGGPILPLDSKLLIVTAINPFRPRRWKYALINFDDIVEFEVIDDIKRPVLMCADFQQFYFIRKIRACLDKNTKYTLLFDHTSNLANKIMKEQFAFD